MPLFLLALCLAADPAPVDPVPVDPDAGRAVRYDHHGAVGLIVLLDGVTKATAGNNVVPDNGLRGGFDIGGTYNIGYSSDELLLMGRLAFGGSQIETSLYFGYRSYFGHEQWKTVLDIDLAGHFTPYLTAGVRFGVGVQYEISPIAGLFAGIAGQMGFGQIVMFKGELVVGVQFRSFLLE